MTNEEINKLERVKEAIRKIAALAVVCMEHNDCQPRKNKNQIS